MCHKGEIFGPAPLAPPARLSGIGLQRHADRMVEDQVDNGERLPLQGQTVFIGKIVNAAAKDVVLRNDFLDIECRLGHAADHALANCLR